MKPTEVLAREQTPDGEELSLVVRDGVYSLRLGGTTLMWSRAYGSELALATLACARIAGLKGPRVLIGGLGFGYTLRAALDCLPSAAVVSVWEFSSMVLTAMRGPLADLTARPLDDPRVEVIQGDVRDALGKERFDAILLDVDNGPSALTLSRNQRLYSAAGLELLKRSLAAKGILAIWSENRDAAFERRLQRGGFALAVETARGGERQRGVRHTIFLAQRLL